MWYVLFWSVFTKAVLNAPREMLIEKTDLEEETVDEVIRILKSEFEEEDPGKGLTTVMLTLYKYVGWLAVGLVAAVLPLLISIGAHKAFIPYVVASLGDPSLGYEILYNGASLAHNISESGASLAVALKTKDPELRSTAFSCGVSALFGVTEPAIYSITIQRKKVLYGVMVGSFISGSFIGLMAVKAFVAMGPGLAGMAMFVDPENTMNIVWAFAGFGIALVSSFIATLFLYKDEAKAEAAPAGQLSGELSAQSSEPEDDTVKPGSLVSPLQGTVVRLEDVKDEVFSTGVLGQGAAVRPAKGELYAPVNGTVTMICLLYTSFPPYPYLHYTQSYRL